MADINDAAQYDASDRRDIIVDPPSAYAPVRRSDTSAAAATATSRTRVRNRNLRRIDTGVAVDQSPAQSLDSAVPSRTRLITRTRQRPDYADIDRIVFIYCIVNIVKCFVISKSLIFQISLTR